jgi:hypothetical protein
MTDERKNEHTQNMMMKHEKLTFGKQQRELWELRTTKEQTNTLHCFLFSVTALQPSVMLEKRSSSSSSKKKGTVSTGQYQAQQVGASLPFCFVFRVLRVVFRVSMFHVSYFMCHVSCFHCMFSLFWVC